jgi:DMSO/TMAO reductase YedYZ molybdopterin-dependent catalytic subunit
VEGWSAIGQWTGVQLGLLLKAAGVLPGARYAVLYCADNLDGEPAKGGMQSPGQYYESIDLIDARHPQTLIAYDMNGSPLDVAHGAPLRLRVERQLGYKQAKYVQRIALVSSLAGIGGGRGGYWEDRGYEWYAGI